MALRQHRWSRWRPRPRGLAPALIAALCALTLTGPAGPAQAQFFGDRYFEGGYGGYGYHRYYQPRQDFGFPFGDRFMRPAPPPADYSKAPPPRKLETPPTTNIVVIGDSLADWLAYGLDETYTDQPDMGVERKIRATSGLIRYDSKNESLDWPDAIKDALAGEKPSAIVVMLGLNDRLPLKDRIPPKPTAAKPGEAPEKEKGQEKAQEKGQEKAQEKAQEKGQGGQSQAQESAQKQDKAQGQPQAEAKQGQAPAQQSSQSSTAADSEGGAQPEEARPTATGGTFDFHTDKWAELYGRRVDEMIAALKTKGVPILWVGLPALRGTKSTGDMAYLDEIYRERAEKAGIVYVDIWDGFVDDQGRYTVQGPDFEGQTRKLRTADGVHFTKAGAVKLASYVDQDLRRVMSKGATPVALPGPDSNAPKAATVGTHPDIGPVLPLSSNNRGGEGDTTLLGGGRPAQITSTDPLAAKVLTRGDAINAPADRADNFAWPRPDKSTSAAPDTGPLPAPVPMAPAVPAAQAPKKGADGKAIGKASDGKAADRAAESKAKAASEQASAKPRRAGSATLDGAAPPRPPRDVGGGF